LAAAALRKAGEGLYPGFQGIRKYGGESGIVLAANSKITLKMQKSIDLPADTREFTMAGMV
jgi:hypothetical protein